MKIEAYINMKWRYDLHDMFYLGIFGRIEKFAVHIPSECIQTSFAGHCGRAGFGDVKILQIFVTGEILFYALDDLVFIPVHAAHDKEFWVTHVPRERLELSRSS